MNATPEKKTSVRAAEAVLIAGIAAMMLFPLAGMFFGFRASGALGEKRTLKEWPAWSWDSTAIRQWPRDVEAFLDDRFAMRDRLIRWHHRFCYFTLGFSPQPAVVKGRDGWLFYNSAEKNNGDEMSDCLGSRPLTAAELDRLTREFKRRSDWLKQKGIPFLIIVAPNKSTIYREHLPPGMSPRGPSPLEQLSAAMTNFPDVNFFDPMPLLLAAKKEKQVYYQTDTHWNDEGAFRVYRESISRARAAGIKVEAPESSDYKTTRIVDAPGYDLSVMLGIDDLVLEHDETYYSSAGGRRRKIVPLDPRAPAGPKISNQNRPDMPSVLMIGDSFGEVIMPFFTDSFGLFVFQPGMDFSEDWIALMKPNFVIQEIAERYIRIMARSAFPPGKPAFPLPDNVP